MTKEEILKEMQNLTEILKKEPMDLKELYINMAKEIVNPLK